jgi:O-antigen/teichoic acid export membrane protein
MAIVSRAIFPIQCEMQNDKKALRDSFLNYLRLSFFVIFPLMIGIAILSRPIVSVILTDKWMQIEGYLSILSIAYSLTPIMVVNNQILLVSGRSDLFLTLELVKKTVGIVIMYLTIPYGLNVTCWGVVGYNIFDAASGVFYAKKTIDVGYVDQFKSIYKIAIAATLMAAVVYFSISLFSHDIVKIIVGLLVGVSSYILLGVLLRIRELNYFLPGKLQLN